MHLIFASLLFSVSSYAADCPARLGREDLDGRLASAEQEVLDLDPEGFRDDMNELGAFVVPCMGDLVPPDISARYHRLVALQRITLDDEAGAEVAAAAAKSVAPDAPFPEGALPPTHPLRLAWEAAAPAKTHKVPKPRSGTVAFDGVSTRERPVGVPTVAQVFDESGVAVNTAYLGPRDPMPLYPAVPMKRIALASGSGGALVAGVALWAATVAAHNQLYALADDPTTPAADIDAQRGLTNALSIAGGASLGLCLGLGAGAVLVGPR